MPRMAVGRAAADLPWLCPNTTGLVGLAERPADLPALAAADPALSAFLARFALEPDAAPGPFQPQRLLSATLPDAAAAFLGHTSAGWLDPLSTIVIDLDAVAARAAALAREIAVETGRIDPDAAALAARLAPLGWYAVAAVDRQAARDCLRDPDFAADPGQCQRDHWGLDAHAIARRLVRRWRFPDWLASVLSGLDLPATARAAGPHADLAAVVSLAVAEAQAETIDLGLTPKTPAGGRRQPAVAGLPERPADAGRPPGPHPDPNRVPLIRNLLRAAAEARRRTGPALVLRLERQIDDLYGQLARVADAAERDRTADKLAALAELAAGAGHEINNPLAVISGHAQRLIRTEQDDDRADSLRAVVRQTQRIAGILRELMLFARPPKPAPGRVAVSDLFAAVGSDLDGLAAERAVRIEVVNTPADVAVDADAGQLRLSLAAVVRNAVEAAGENGWVRLRGEVTPLAVRIVVEDGGPGLAPDATAHAFDPFYCGRPAGRGRGLGLPTAWRLARQNGGDLRHEPGDSPTRFVFTFPRSGEAAFPVRDAA